MVALTLMDHFLRQRGQNGTPNYDLPTHKVKTTMKHIRLPLIPTLLAMALTFVSGIAMADSIRFATTTSTYNSGLLDYLLNHYANVSQTEVPSDLCRNWQSVKDGRKW